MMQSASQSMILVIPSRSLTASVSLSAIPESIVPTKRAGDWAWPSCSVLLLSTMPRSGWNLITPEATAFLSGYLSHQQQPILLPNYRNLVQLRVTKINPHSRIPYGHFSSAARKPGPRVKQVPIMASNPYVGYVGGKSS